MACVSPTNISVLSIVLLAGLPGLGFHAAVSARWVKPDQRSISIAQSTTPVYRPTAPPSPVTPLPDQRQRQEESNIGSDYRISALQADSRGNLWVGSWQGLAKIDPKTGRILARISIPNATIGALAMDRVGRIWVGTYEGLVRIDPNTGKITAQNFSLPSNRILSMLIDKRGYLWVGTDNGLVLISPDQGLVMTTIKNLPGVSANALSLDVRGNLWVGTLDGLVQVNTASALLMRQVTDLPGTAVQALASYSQIIPWNDPSLARNPQARKPTSKPGLQRTPATSRKPAKPANQAPTPSPITKSFLWVGTPSGLVELDTETGRIVQTPSGLQGRNISALKFDRTNRLWVGTSEGLLRVNPATGKVDGQIIAKLPSSQIVSLSADTGGKLWVGTSEGLAWVSMQTFRTGVHNTFSRR